MSGDELQQEFLVHVINTWGHKSAHTPERALRFLEEALEAVQAAGVGEEIARRVVGMVYANPPGAVDREIGAAGLTLAGLAESLGVSLDRETRREMTRLKAMSGDDLRSRHVRKVTAGASTVLAGGA